MKAKKILAKTPDNKSNNTQPDSIGACFQSKVDGGGNNDGAKNPKEKMKKAKKYIAYPISKALCDLYPRKGASIVQRQKEWENIPAGRTTHRMEN